MAINKENTDVFMDMSWLGVKNDDCWPWLDFPLFIITRFLVILTLLPIFRGSTCVAISSAEAFLITFTTVCMLRGCIEIYKNYFRWKKGESILDKPIPVKEDILGVAIMGISIWGFVITFPNTQYLTENPLCEKNYYGALFITSIILCVVWAGILFENLVRPLLRKSKAADDVEDENAGEGQSSLNESLLPETV